MTLSMLKDVQIHLTDEEQADLRRFINRAHTGSEIVNTRDGRPRFPEAESVLQEAHHRVARTKTIRLCLNFGPDARVVSASMIL